jgi:hypothetical protein
VNEFESLQRSLSGVQDDLRRQAEARTAQNALMAEQTEALKAVKDRLPSFIERRQFWPTIVAVLLVVVLAVVGGYFTARAVAGARDEAIRRNACALRGVLAQAQSSGSRNPIPSGLDEQSRRFVEDSRKQAAEFYGSALADIDATLSDLGGPPCAPPPTGAASR